MLRKIFINSIVSLAKNTVPFAKGPLNLHFSEAKQKSISKQKFLMYQTTSSQQTIVSLSQQQITQLRMISHYVVSVSHLQKNNLQQSLKYLRLSLISARSMFEQSINLHVCILNRMSILLKLLGKDQQFVQVLQEIFLTTLSLKGIRSLDTVKSLSNYLLALLMNDWSKGILMMQFLQETNPQFVQILMKHPKINFHFYRSIFHILNGYKQEGIKTLGQIPHKTTFQTYFRTNNIQWLKIMSLQADPNSHKTIKQSSHSLLRQFVECLVLSQSKFISNCRRQLFRLRIQIQRNQQIAYKMREQVLQILQDYCVQGQQNDLSKLQSISPQTVVLLGKNSHIIAANISHCLFLSQKYNLALFFASLSLQTGLKFNEIDRVGRALIFIASINEKSGDPQSSQKMFLDILQNSRNYTKNLIKFCLENYAKLLYKRGYFIQAQGYINQSKRIVDRQSEHLGSMWFEGLILPEYDFSF